MWRLIIEAEPGERFVVPLKHGYYSLGRAKGNDIRLTEMNVSRQHARLIKRGDAFFIEDLESYNGTFVNAARLGDAEPIHDGDLIQIGDYVVLFEREGAAITELAAIVPAARAHRLLMLEGPAPGSEYPLDKARLVVGRADEADISVNVGSVSRQHCEILALPGDRFEVIDLGSSNGVRVNGTLLPRAILDADDVLALGDVSFKLLMAGAASPPAAVAARRAREIPADLPPPVHPEPVPPPPRTLPILPFAVLFAVLLAGGIAAVLLLRS
jgi:pSer/pThr/pTyr-binding forkhead associated (FHA) protein